MFRQTIIIIWGILYMRVFKGPGGELTGQEVRGVSDVM